MTEASAAIAAVVLAAGGGRRYGMPKALVEYEGSLLVERAVRTARAVCDPVLVVLGARAMDVWRQADLEGATVLANKDWETGMASSLRMGLARAARVAGWGTDCRRAAPARRHARDDRRGAAPGRRSTRPRTRWPWPPTTACAGTPC